MNLFDGLGHLSKKKREKGEEVETLIFHADVLFAFFVTVFSFSCKVCAKNTVFFFLQRVFPLL